MNKRQVTALLLSVGACWATSSDKYVDPNDPLEAQEAGHRTYHVHPDQSHPHQDNILRFDTLDEIASWCNAVKVGNAANDDVQAAEIMQAWADGYD